MLRKRANDLWHRLGRHKRRADERQKDQRVGERIRTFDGRGGKPRDCRNPRQRQRKDREDSGYRQPRAYARGGAEAHQQRDE
ncbi:hypothetical protein SDC9_205914 [bioreactor metagenome]|uniref:Uncharacterized protein n=1 Tax=bioreactor metagenome TaxID=1076179 RepID=A0A645J3K3_9ZZZZ